MGRFERAAQAGVARAEGLKVPERRAQELPPEAEGAAEEEALENRYLFWTYQQVLDAFCRSDEMQYSPFVQWRYRRFAGAEFDGWFIVKFCDGFVVYVESS